MDLIYPDGLAGVWSSTTQTSLAIPCQAIGVRRQQHPMAGVDGGLCCSMEVHQAG